MADDDRPQYQSGLGTINGTTFHWGSGTPGKYWSIPYGDYPVTPDAPTGAWAHQAGAIPIANNVIPDPQLGRNRIGIMIHSGSAASLDQLYTQGCFKVDPQDWPNVRSQILAEANKGPLYLHVAPGGVAAFTNTKTFSQAGGETPAANANAAANTTAASIGGAQAAPAFKLPDNAPMGMQNNNPLNIKYVAGAPYAGLVGPSKNTDQGDPQMVFSSPEAGWSAAYQLLSRKYGGGMTTPAAIIAGKGGWTPGNMQAAANVAKSAGIGVNDDIGFSDPGKAAKFMRALVTQEQGGASSAYSDAMIGNAISGKWTPSTTTAAAPAASTPATPGTTVTSVPAAAGSGGGVLPGFGTKEASDQFLAGLKQAGITPQTGAPSDSGQQPDMRPSPIMAGPGLRNASSPMSIGQQAAQLEPRLTGYQPTLYGSSLNSQPMAWSNQPIAAPAWMKAGAQGAPGLGTSLNSLQAMDPQAYADRMAMLYGTSGGFGGGYG